MLKIDPAFLFDLASTMRRIRDVGRETHVMQGHTILTVASQNIRQAVEASIYSHVFRMPVRTSGYALLSHIENMLVMPADDDEYFSKPFPLGDVVILHQLYGKFETLFVADLQAAALYLVAPKGGYDTNGLIEAGEGLFSQELPAKVPDAVPDLKEAARCIAFELPTAAGFHLHRAHESVLKVYWDCVTGGLARPEENNMGVYLRELDSLDKGRMATRLHLRSIKDFHRNPLMHPDQSLENVDQALDLLAAIRCSIGYMLQEIPGNDPPMLAAMEAED